MENLFALGVWPWEAVYAPVDDHIFMPIQTALIVQVEFQNEKRT